MNNDLFTIIILGKGNITQRSLIEIWYTKYLARISLNFYF